jgi:hypothetical protein
MKLISLRIQRSHRSTKLDKPSSGTDESFSAPTVLPDQVHTYKELQQQIHEDLRVQHPEWIQPDGKSPQCDSYEARLVQLLAGLPRRESHPSIVDPHRLLEQGLT